MPVHEYTPHALLAPFIHTFCYVEREFTVVDSSFTILPDTMIEMVWCFGAACSLSILDEPLPACYSIGLLATPLIIQAHGLVQLVRARFYPWGLLPLIHTFLQPIADSRVCGLIGVAKDLHLAPSTLSGRASDQGASAVAQVQQRLLAHVPEAALSHRSTVHAAQILRAQQGNTAIRALAHQVGLSERSLRRAFQTTMQTSPKEFARLARFEYVRDTLWHRPDASLATIASEAGYSDQAHMQREFRRFSQRTPHQFAIDMAYLHSLLHGASGRNLQDI